MVAFTAFPFEGLFDLACQDGVDIRPTLLRVLTDLYVQKPAHTAPEEAQYVELAGRLIDSVDEQTRATVAARLATYPAAPAPVLARLGEIVQTAAPPLVPALTEPHLQPNAVEEISDASEIFRAPDEDELVELFFDASAEERRLILTNLDTFVPIAGHRTPLGTPGVLIELENAALQRNTAAFARTLERALGIRAKLAERVVNDRSGEPIVVAAKALGMRAAVLQRILLFINSHVGQSVARVYDLAHLFDEITPAAAEDMVSIWRQASRARSQRHEPALSDGARLRPRAAATHAARPASGRDYGKLSTRFYKG